jgi:outer membrane protein assembly factor BamB
MVRLTRHTLALLLAAACCTAAPARAADWPHWLGPNFNGSSSETGLLVKWPAEGPRVLWKVPGGKGYSSVVVADGRAITLVQRDNQEWVVALEAATGKQLWATPIAGAFKNNFGDGPRSTPTVEGKFVYAQSVSGPVVCLDAAKGNVVWKTDLFKEFKTKNITWGLSASPLVDGDLVFVLPGDEGAGVAALNKKDGTVAWKTGDDRAAYATPVAVTVDGQRQVIFFTARGLLGVTAKDGKELWRIRWKTDFDVNICTPLVVGNRMFVASGEHVGCAVYELTGKEPKLVWQSKGKKSVLMTYWANAVHQDGYLYGLSGEFNGRIDLNCVDFKTGNRVWSKEDFGKGAMTLAQGHLFMSTKAGDVVLVQADPKGYQEKARVKMLGENRTVPTLSDRRLFLRDLEHIYCLDIAAK